MKKSRLTEAQVIAVLREHDGGGLPATWDQRIDLLPVEGQVWRDAGVRGVEAEDA